jgi:hypothetical protein
MKWWNSGEVFDGGVDDFGGTDEWSPVSNFESRRTSG